ncbi:MAG TPA: class I SAM-dependent methyltransferase [Gaiellaceae bacterium]|jgi:SAM-dependent methyltransferase|nr:class I SAM-dependent methyltransferase [Gaiellaceae bacterium]
MTGPRQRRLVFGEVAEQYDRRRPSYPRAVFSDALAFSGYEDGERVLEVGAGTGKATAGLVAAGARVVALEPSTEMAAVARRRFTGDDRVVIVDGTEFEQWPGDGDAFALLLAAQAWHWIDPAVRLARAHERLRTEGAVALVWNQPHHPDTELRHALDLAYDELGAATIGRFARGARPDGQDVAIEELRGSSWFVGFELLEHRHSVDYDAVSYLELLDTHSDHRMMGPEEHDRLVERIGALVDAAGGVTVDYCATTALARTVS